MSGAGNPTSTRVSDSGRQLESGCPEFEKTVKKSTYTTLTFPIKFVRKYLRVAPKFAALESSEQDNVLWPVTINHVFNPSGEALLKFGKGWADFVASHSLVNGDRLIFYMLEGSGSSFHVDIIRKLHNSD